MDHGKIPRRENISFMSEKMLKEKGFVRLSTPGSNMFKVVRCDSLDESKRFCSILLNKFPGYLYSLDRERMRDTLNNRDLFDIEKLKISKKRITNLIDAGVPPLWDANLEGGGDILITHEEDGGILTNRKHHKFPNVDFVLQFGSGSYFPRRKWRGGLREEGILSGIGRANLDDIIDFRTYAMPGGKVNPILEREIVFWLEDKFQFREGKNKPIERTLETLHSIVEKLREFPAGNPKYEVWDGEDISFIREPVWYLFFSDENREGIVNKYLENTLNPEGKHFLGKSRGESTYDRMNYLFEFEADLLVGQKVRDERLILDMIDREDFRDMTYQMFEGNENSGKELLYTHIEDQYKKLQEEDSEFIFLGSQKITKALKFSPTIYLKDPEVKAFVDGLRAKYLMEVSDNSLLKNI